MTVGISGPTDYEAKRVLDFQFGNGTPTNLFIGLLSDTNTAAQRRAGTVTEVSTSDWTNYARVQVTNNTTEWPAASGSNPAVKSNANPVDFGTAATTTNVNVTAYGFWDALTGGNFKGYADFVDGSGNRVTLIVQDTNPVSIAAGAIQIKL